MFNSLYEKKLYAYVESHKYNRLILLKPIVSIKVVVDIIISIIGNRKSCKSYYISVLADFFQEVLILIN